MDIPNRKFKIMRMLTNHQAFKLQNVPEHIKVQLETEKAQIIKQLSKHFENTDQFINILMQVYWRWGNLYTVNFATTITLLIEANTEDKMIQARQQQRMIEYAEALPEVKNMKRKEMESLELAMSDLLNPVTDLSAMIKELDVKKSKKSKIS